VFGKNKDIIQHVKTEEFFYITEFPNDLNNNNELQYWVNLIRKPVNLKHYIWPVDVIELATETSQKQKYALVFPMRALPVFETIGGLLSNDMQAGWNMPWVKKFVANLLDAWCCFDASKYAYHEFSINNMFYQKENFDVMFDFSFSTQKVADLYSTRIVNKSRITPDYADSYFYIDGRNSLMDLASDYYSIAVILFKLLIGRLPYQGKVMEHEPNANELEHKNWLRVYHKNTYFIFDKNDNTNHIGGETGFAKDEIYVERWNELAEHVRNMFHNVFQTANVLRTSNNLIFYSPSEWKDALFGEKPAEIKLVYRTANDKGTELPPEESDTVSSKNKSDAVVSLTNTLKPEQKTRVVRNDPCPCGSGKKYKMCCRTDVDATTPTSERKRRVISNDPCPCGSGKKYKMCCRADVDGVLGVNGALIKEQSSSFYDVILTKTPESDKIMTIKVIREITGLGLMPAKEHAENTPVPIVQGVSESLAKQIQAELLLVNAETKLTANTKQDEKIETYVNQRMLDRWQSRI